jgi:molybdate transport system substrate-binding protein
MATRQILADAVGLFAEKTGFDAAIESVGGVEAARRVRLGERFDLVALAAESLEKLEAEGHIASGTRTAFALSPMAVAVRAGAPHPDISDEQAVRGAVAAARAVGCSTGPSGAHLMRLLKDWGFEGADGPRIVQAPPGVPVALLVARGEASLGFQQLSELMGEPDIEIVGLLPPAIQSTTVFSIGVGARSSNLAEARAFIACLNSPQADEAKRRRGMEPA